MHCRCSLSLSLKWFLAILSLDSFCVSFLIKLISPAAHALHLAHEHSSTHKQNSTAACLAVFVALAYCAYAACACGINRNIAYRKIYLANAAWRKAATTPKGEGWCRHRKREREREKRGRREGDGLFQQLQLEALRVASRNFQFISHVYEYL